MIQAARARRRALTSLFLALALAAPLAAQETKDTVRLKDGKTESGKIKSEDYSGLVMAAAGGGKEDKIIPWSDIVSGPDAITYAGSPQYQSAADNLNQGKYDEALAALTELKGEAKLRAPLKQNAVYYIGFIQQRQGKPDEALATYKDLLTEFPKSRYLMNVGEGLVAIYVAKKDMASATKALDQLSTDAATAGVDPGFSSAISVLKGRVFEEQKKYPEAQAQYAVAEKATNRDVSAQAVLGQARCAVALNKKTEAQELFRRLVTQDAANVVLAGAWNGLGDLLLEEGKPKAGSKPDPDKILDALYCYLRGIVQYAPLPGESTHEYERSLAFAAECFRHLSTLETKPEAKALYKARSEQRLDELRKQFPNSPYLPGR